MRPLSLPSSRDGFHKFVAVPNLQKLAEDVDGRGGRGAAGAGPGVSVLPISWKFIAL